MSRTFKDRPYWVRANDRNEERLVHHDHFRFGQPVYKNKKVLDENGKPVMKDMSYTHVSSIRVVYTSGAIRNYLPWRWNALKGTLNMSEVRRVREITTTREYMVPLTERILIGYIEDHCTAHENAVKQDSGERFKPCGSYLAHYSGEKLMESNQKQHHRSSRSTERDSLKKAAVLANSYEDYEDEWDASLTRQKFHTNW